MAWKARELFTTSKGFPLYCAAWVKEGASGTGGKWTVVLGGGGGEGQRGITNALELCEFDPQSISYPDVRKLTADVPHKIVVHPKGNVVFCSFSDSCRWLEIRNGSTPAEEWRPVFEDAGLQTALACHSDTDNRETLLATGGEDGHLRVFEWSNVKSESIFDIPAAHTSVKDLVFSRDGMLLATLGSCGSCRVWRIKPAANREFVVNIPRENNEVFGFCKFSQTTDTLLYLTSDQGPKRSIVSWKYSSDPSQQTVVKQTICVDRISAFDASADGKLLAIGTIEGDVIVFSTSNMSLLTTVKKAHLGLVTTLAFDESRELLSASVDARVTVTSIKKDIIDGLTIPSIISLLPYLVFVLAFLVSVVCCYKRFGTPSPIFPSFRFDKTSFDFSFGLTAGASKEYEHPAT